MAKAIAQTKPLTLKLDGDLPLEQFKVAVDAFCELVKAVTADLPGGESIQWSVQVREGSNVIQLSPKSSSLQNMQLSQAVKTIKTGMNALARGDKKRPRHFSDYALRQAKRLAKTANEDLFVQLNAADSTVRLSTQLVASVDSHLEPFYEDYGSTEGELLVVSASDGLVFHLLDPVTQVKIRCVVAPELEQRVLQAFRRRVIAWGLLKYRADGVPTSIKVEDFKVIPLDHELPTVEQFLHALPKPRPSLVRNA